MRDFDTTHLIFLAVTAAFFALSMYFVARLPRFWQNLMFVFAALMVVGGVFFRYGMGMTLEGAVSWRTLALQMLQVCNFNLILVVLMLVPRFELARQYSVFFSMFAASTTLVSIPNVWANYSCFHPEVLNSWCNHVFAMALPLWMIAARRLKPRKEYILPVGGCVLGYFAAVAAVSALLIKFGILTVETSHSFVFKTDGIGVFEMLWDLIPIPFVYLIPLLVPMFAVFVLWAWAFRNYKTERY